MKVSPHGSEYHEKLGRTVCGEGEGDAFPTPGHSPLSSLRGEWQVVESVNALDIGMTYIEAQQM